MFFDEKEMKIAEDFAWKMPDGWNHSCFPNLQDYAHFYFKNKVIPDPWMNEKSQRLVRPDHTSKECAVNPVEYYGRSAIEDFIVKLFMLCPERNPEIAEKIRKNLDD